MTNPKPKLLHKSDWMSLKDCADLFQKSVHTIKKLAYSKKVKSKKESGKHGEELRLFIPDLLEYYNITFEGLQEAKNHGITKTQNGIDHGSTKYPNHGTHQTKIIEMLEKQIVDLIKDKENLQKMLDQKDEQLKQQQKITENQQTLSLHQNRLLLDNKETKKKGGGIFGWFDIKN